MIAIPILFVIVLWFALMMCMGEEEARISQLIVAALSLGMAIFLVALLICVLLDEDMNIITKLPMLLFIPVIAFYLVIFRDTFFQKRKFNHEEWTAVVFVAFIFYLWPLSFIFLDEWSCMNL